MVNIWGSFRGIDFKLQRLTILKVNQVRFYNMWFQSGRRYVMLPTIVFRECLSMHFGACFMPLLTNDIMFHGQLITANLITGVEGMWHVVLIPRIRDAIRRNSFGMNPLRTNENFIRHWTWAKMVQVTACRLYGTKPHPQPLLTYSKRDLEEQIEVKFEPKYPTFLQENACKCQPYCWNLSVLTHWGRDKMAATSQTTLSIAFSWMKMLQFRLSFHWSLFLRVQITIFWHWFR